MNFISRINKFCMAISGLVLMATMVMAVLNMILRPLGHPITGSFELLGFGCAIVTALGLGYSYERKVHIAVDILFKKLSAPLRKFLALLGQLVCGAFFLAVAWKMTLLAMNFMENGELSETLGIPFYPVTGLVALGVFFLSLNIFHSAFSNIFPGRSGVKK